MKLCPKCQKQFSDDANFCPVDAARLAPLEAQPSGTDSLLARFELGQRLGGSRTGSVLRATDKTTNQPVVVKLVAPAVVSPPGVAQRLARELRQLERVQSAGVARVIASGTRGEEIWMAMELLEGAHTLEEAILARGPVSPVQAADLIEVVGEALIEAAQVGVVHRDLAPKNVLFAGQDLKLINFSLPVPTEKIPGVAEFVAPEQVDGRPVDQRSNLYSLGALYYFVLTGQTVFSGSADEVHRQHQSGTIKPPSQLVSEIGAGSPIEVLILRALDRSPTKRFLTVRQFVDQVTRVGHGEVIELKPRVQRPKAELVSTLMGVRTKSSVISSAPTVGTGVPSVVAPVVAPVVAQPRAGSQPNNSNNMASTMIGVSSGLSSGVQPAPAPVVQPARPMQAPPMQAAAVQVTAPGQGPSVTAPSPARMHAQTTLESAPVQSPPAASPWAQQQVAVAPVIQAPVVAAPQVAPVIHAPVVAAPQIAAPQVAAQPAGKQRAPEPGQQKGKFRETMWFKKGDLDTKAAVDAADERARTGKDVDKDKADSLPMDERYKDDGSITRGDKDKYSLRTGATQMMQALRPDGAGQSTNKVSEDALIGEMKGGRSKIIIGIVIAVAVILIIVLAAK